ncbi:conserved Plasmodium protein, unknown function [Plasmodium knowlesi strain H]|uniref:Uncharacterized protein n=3 Tax=Plasmodium knowlesi TaxID=5850 RepID=A0A5K1VM18_PLAKH|nr:conserved Plasmodium protein, unknown function [Plasmodium knowlesi strain H]OTN67988.1 Uncharacterized protein PKNOH_S04350100 [Plasmodium knowlesi]CAA9990186.1 conserved Plasmodium protein, unknown function [Plasmodium knowlesi strain H]SBO27467.1 conserved Plasmodium protein, unknown function [Plasmodium knowlesi strain H]SBO28490.1 conserved Plasmodium protein, unknown function [Plasmodium knowlesi strain H]VVS79660.1 conserved Plasmodium protein, unknown function [Plasmodium knowlesi s|eukprot:XP_002258115.1 hypothetical protein, conserved in Plasmodium species [Plasmodium knowlesi strain H]
MCFLKLVLSLVLLLLDLCETRAKGSRQGSFFLRNSIFPGQGRRCVSRTGRVRGVGDEANHMGDIIDGDPKEADTKKENLRINKFEAQEVKINSNLNVNVFRNTNDTTSAYDDGICIYNLLKDIEVKDVKRIPTFSEKLANVHIEKEKDYIKLKKGEEKGTHLDNPLIYRDTNYELPYVLNYYPDDMFIFNFDGVINMNKQEQIVVAFLTFLRLFQRNGRGGVSKGYPTLLLNGKPIDGLPLYNFIQSRKYLFAEGDENIVPPQSDDPFILLKLIPKFLYSRFLYLYKFIKTTEDLVIGIKYVFDEIDAICTKYSYDINEMLRICREKNVMQTNLEKLSAYYHEQNFKQPSAVVSTKGSLTPSNINQPTPLHIYNLVKELTKGTFNPSIIRKYKKIENFANVFPSFHNDFNNFYKKKMNLELYQRYKVDPKWVRTEFERTRKLLSKHDKDAYINLMQYRYPCEMLSEEERQNHMTFNFCAVDLINHNINVFKKPIYVVSTMEDGDYIEYTLKLFGVNIANKENSHLLRIFGKDYLRKEEDCPPDGDSNSVMNNLKKLFKSPYFAKRESPKKGERQGDTQDDYLYDPYNVDLEYLKYQEKKKKRDYNFINHRYYLDMLKEKCNLINFVIEKYHRGDETIHIIDHKYEDLNAMCNDSRFSQKVRLYFCEWGYNSYADRLKALYNDRVKSFSQSFKLVFLCCTLQDNPRREHTHGRGLPTDFYTKFMLKYFHKKGLFSPTEEETRRT